MEPTQSKPEEIVYEKGKLEVPTSLIVAIVTCLMTSIGSCSAAAFQQYQAGQIEKKADDALNVRVDIATMKNDIQWIKNRLSATDRPASDSR